MILLVVVSLLPFPPDYRKRSSLVDEMGERYRLTHAIAIVVKLYHRYTQLPQKMRYLISLGVGKNRHRLFTV